MGKQRATTPKGPTRFKLAIRAFHAATSKRQQNKFEPYYGKRCYWCDRELAWPKMANGQQYIQKNLPNRPTIEHLIPRSKGGTSHRSNLVIACQECNTRRGSDTTWVSFGSGLPMPRSQREAIRQQRA